MKKLFLLMVVVVMTVFNANAQVKVVSPHPDLDVKITRCVYADGTVIIDMVITNYGPDETIAFTNTKTSNRGEITAYDDEGNMYNSKVSEIKGGLTSQGLKKLHHTYFEMPQDVPLKFRFQISKISSRASKLVLLKLPLESKGAMSISRGKSITISNLEWVK